MNNILIIIIGILYVNLFDKIMTSIYSRYYAKKCNYECKNCGNWACVHETEYEKGNYIIGIYDDYSNVCGKEKNEKNKKI